MEMQELEITIDKEGRMQVTVRGVRGEGCAMLTKNIENAVGIVKKREYTSEYYEQPPEVSTREHKSF